VQPGSERLGSSHSEYETPTPEQQTAVTSVSHSVSGPTQRQAPPLHTPDAHPAGSSHAAPFGRGAWHVPALQKPDWQSPSPVQAPPFGLRPHVPSVQLPVRHCAALEQGWPSGRPHLPW
jgi:hypothetical protein